MGSPGAIIFIGAIVALAVVVWGAFRSRRSIAIAVVAVFVVAAVLTPPDPVSQISLAVPIILLYEISIYMAKMVERKRAREEAAEDYSDDDEADSGSDVTPPES